MVWVFAAKVLKTTVHVTTLIRKLKAVLYILQELDLGLQRTSYDQSCTQFLSVSSEHVL